MTHETLSMGHGTAPKKGITMSKEEKRKVIVWDVVFALEDENGDVVYDDKGNVAIYRNGRAHDEGDYEYLADKLKPEDLEIHDYC
jgi:hypothetical protein